MICQHNKLYVELNCSLWGSPFWSILGKRALFGKLELESLIVMAIVIKKVVLPHPFEQIPLPKCEGAEPVVIPPISRTIYPAKPCVSFPQAGIDLVVPERN